MPKRELIPALRFVSPRTQDPTRFVCSLVVSLHMPQALVSSFPLLPTTTNPYLPLFFPAPCLLCSMKLGRTPLRS